MILSLSDGPWSPPPARLPRRAVTLRLLRVFSICLTVSRSSDTISRYLGGVRCGRKACTRRAQQIVTRMPKPNKPRDRSSSEEANLGLVCCAILAFGTHLQLSQPCPYMLDSPVLSCRAPRPVTPFNLLQHHHHHQRTTLPKKLFWKQFRMTSPTFPNTPSQSCQHDPKNTNSMGRKPINKRLTACRRRARPGLSTLLLNHHHHRRRRWSARCPPTSRRTP